MRHSLWPVSPSNRRFCVQVATPSSLRWASTTFSISCLKELCILFSACPYVNTYDGCVHASIMPYHLQCIAEICTDPPQAVKELVMGYSLGVLQC